MPKITKVLLNAITDTITRQHTIATEQNDLLNKNVVKYYARIEEETPDNIYREIHNAAKKDFTDAKSNDDVIKAYGFANIKSYPLKFNKMAIIYQYVQKFAEIESNLSALLSGRLPYENLPCLPDIAANSENFWGTSKSTFLSAILVSSHLTLENTILTPYEFLNSSILEFAPIPAGLDSLEESSNIFMEDSGATHFGFIHSGYAYDGTRIPSSLYTTQRQFMPEDCSSWTAKLTGLVTRYTPLDQLYLARVLKNNATGLYPEWESGNEYREMNEKYKLVSTEELQPGDIIFARNFADGEDKMATDGKGGHTAIVLELPTSEEVKTISANRDMPNIEGIVVNNFKLAGIDRIVEAFRLKEEHEVELPINPIFESFIGEEYPDIATLWGAVNSKLYPDMEALD